MKPFNPKIVVISRFNLLATLFTHGLLTACNHVGTYHAIEDQASTKEASSTPIEHRLGVEARKYGPQDLDQLYNNICDSRYNCNYSSSLKGKRPIDHLIAFKEAVENGNIPFHAALKACSRRTGRMLSYHHLYESTQASHFELIAQVIYADVVDSTSGRVYFDQYCRDCSKETRIISNALSCMDKIKELANKDREIDPNDNSALKSQYKDYRVLKGTLRFQSVPPHVHAQIDTSIFGTLHKIIQNADTPEKRIQLADHISLEDVALFRHAFEIIDETHPDGTGVLYPEIYEILSRGGYRIALSNEDLSRVKTYLKENYPHSFNRCQPNIPLFHDEASKDDMLLNKAYMNIRDATNRCQESHELDKLYRLAIEQKVSFQEALRRCKENTGLMLRVADLLSSMHPQRYGLIINAISAGVVDHESTYYSYRLRQDENLRAYVERYKKENACKIAGNSFYEAQLTMITELLD